MRMTMIALTVAALGFTFSGADAQPAKRSLAGEWKIVSAIDNGNPIPAEQLKDAFIRATATTMAPVVGGVELANDKLELRFLDGNKVDYFEKSNPNRAMPGILEFVDDDNVKMAWVEPTGNNVRPTGFDGKSGRAYFLKRKAK